MAKKSAIYRNIKRIKLTEKFAGRRAELKNILRNPNVTDQEFFEAQRNLALLPRNSSRVRIHNRCAISGRTRGFRRRFGVSRITFRELASWGMIPGVTRASW